MEIFFNFSIISGQFSLFLIFLLKEFPFFIIYFRHSLWLQSNQYIWNLFSVCIVSLTFNFSCLCNGKGTLRYVCLMKLRYTSCKIICKTWNIYDEKLFYGKLILWKIKIFFTNSTSIKMKFCSKLLSRWNWQIASLRAIAPFLTNDKVFFRE